MKIINNQFNENILYDICDINTGSLVAIIIIKKANVNFSEYYVGNSNLPGMEEVIKQMLIMIQNQLIGLIIFSSCGLSSITTTKHVHDV